MEISATNPVTGETKTARVEGGNKIKVFLYNDRTEDSVRFEMDPVTEDNLEDFALRNIAANEELLNRVAAYTGWDKDKLKKAIKDLEDENIQGPSETPTPVPAEETTEEVQTPMPTPVTSPADALTPVTEWSSDAEVTKEPANNPEPVPRSSYTSTPISSVTSTPPNINTPIPALDCSGNTGTSVRDVTS